MKMYWCNDKVRRMCIRENYCTYMDNAEYEKMLDWVADNAPSVENVQYLASWIVSGSEEVAEKSVIHNLLNGVILYTL